MGEYSKKLDIIWDNSHNIKKSIFFLFFLLVSIPLFAANNHGLAIANQQFSIGYPINALEEKAIEYEPKNSETEYALADEEPFAGQKQTLLLNNLGLFLKNFHDNVYINEKTLADLINRIENSKGYCHGLTTLWLYSKWSQFTQPEKLHSYNYCWFKNTIKLIALWDSKKNLDAKATLAMQKFVDIIDFFQFPNQYLEGASQYEIGRQLISGKLDTYGKTLNKKYAIASTFTLEQLTELLKTIVYDDEWLYIIYFGHTMGLFKHGENYYFYDANNNRGEIVATSLEIIATIIFAVANELEQNYVTLGFIIIGDTDEKFHTYPNQKEFLAKTTLGLNKDILRASAEMATIIGCPESLKFYLDQNIELDKDGANSLLIQTMLASDNNRAVMVDLLLKKGAVPNRYVRVQTNRIPDDHVGGKTTLHMAAYFGYIGIVESLLNDPRTNINQINALDGKTALMYAAEKKHVEIVKILLDHHANKDIQDKHGKTAIMLAEDATGQIDEELAKLFQ